MTFDTRETFAKLTSSKAFTEKQAEIIVDILKETHDEVATKRDLELLQTRLDAKFESLEARLFNKILAAQLGTIVLLFGALKYLTH